MTDSAATGNAIRDWQRLLTDERAVATDATLDYYARSTQDVGTRPCCVLYPISTPEVHKVVEVARRHGVPLYPISRGKNWGYGDACAPTSGAAIVDLSRMDRIIDVNTDLGYAVIEPGVSQGQLQGYLNHYGAQLWCDSTGAGPNASLVGNVLDRGFGHTRYGDHFQTCCGMEVVLGSGEIVSTGFGHYTVNESDRVYRYGIGPFIDGLFCQSNFGIVTRIGLWLMPAPEAFSFFYIKVETDDAMRELVDRLRPLRMGGVLQTAIHIGNDLRLLSGMRSYPWEEMGGETPLSEQVRLDMRRAYGLASWNACGSITGTKAHVAATRKALRRAVRGVGKICFVSDAKLLLGERAVKVLQAVGMGGKLARQLEALRPNFNLLKGIPSAEPLQGAQWRLRRPPDDPTADPLDHGAGLLWISPVVPMTGDHVARVLEVTEPVFRHYGFEHLVTFTMLTERAMIAIMNVSFDKGVDGETERAIACYDALFEAVVQAGYVPYRTGLRGLAKLYVDGDPFWDVVHRIKQTLDPSGVIAPGRYVPIRKDNAVSPNRMI